MAFELRRGEYDVSMVGHLLDVEMLTVGFFLMYTPAHLVARSTVLSYYRDPSWSDS